MTKMTLRIATRASQLALWQARYIAGRLEAECGVSTELVEITTSGDTNQSDPLRSFGGLGVFTKEVQRAVLQGQADLAVHSLKDLPTQIHEELQLACVPTRAPVADVLVLPASAEPIGSLAELPPGARVGTGSPRRVAQLLRIRPDLTTAEIRGNLQTRLRKLDDGEYDATILAEAGMERLGLENRMSLRLPAEDFLPAVGQGALGIECRMSDEATAAALQTLEDPACRAAVDAERSVLRTLRAGCHAPLGVLSSGTQGRLTIRAVLFSEDGRDSWEATAAGDSVEAEELGVRCAREILGQTQDADGDDLAEASAD